MRISLLKNKSEIGGHTSFIMDHECERGESVRFQLVIQDRLGIVGNPSFPSVNEAREAFFNHFKIEGRWGNFLSPFHSPPPEVGP